MKVNQITEMTAGAVASVPMPMGEPIKRNESKKTKKTKKVNEGKMKELAYDLEHLDNGNFKKKYSKTKEEMRSLLSEEEVAEADLILIPGQGNKLKSGFIPKNKDRTDHEVEMALSDLYQSAKNAKIVYNLLKNVPEEVGIEGWVQEKIIKANDYLNTIREYLEHKALNDREAGPEGSLVEYDLDRGTLSIRDVNVGDKISYHVETSTWGEKKSRGYKSSGTVAKVNKALEFVETTDGDMVKVGNILSLTPEYLVAEDEQVREESPQAALNRERKKAWRRQRGAKAARRSNPENWMYGVDPRSDREKKAKTNPEDYNSSEDYELALARELDEEIKESDPSGLIAAAQLVKDFIVTAEIDGEVKKFLVRGMTGPNAARERFLKHHPNAKVLDINEEGVAEGLNEMDKSAPQPGRDGKVSHSTYGLRDKKGSDYFKGKEAPGKAITAKQASKDALDILKKQGVAEGKCPKCGGAAFSEESIAEAKDACYRKVKSRYKVWPSAYASGALVKCRKVGASNWGNKSKKK